MTPDSSDTLIVWIPLVKLDPESGRIIIPPSSWRGRNIYANECSWDYPVNNFVQLNLGLADRDRNGTQAPWTRRGLRVSGRQYKSCFSMQDPLVQAKRIKSQEINSREWESIGGRQTWLGRERHLSRIGCREAEINCTVAGSRRMTIPARFLRNHHWQSNIRVYKIERTNPFVNLVYSVSFTRLLPRSS